MVSQRISSVDKRLELTSPPSKPKKAEKDSAIQISLQNLKIIETFLQIQELEGLDLKQAALLTKSCITPPKLDQLAAIYENIQTQKILFYLTLFWWIQRYTSTYFNQQFQQVVPYQGKDAAKLNLEIISLILKTDHLKNWEQKALATFHAWRESQNNFRINVGPNQRLKNHDNKNYRPGTKQQRIWKTNPFEETLATSISALENPNNPLWQASKIILETPVNLYCESSLGKLMSWVQPSLIFNQRDEKGQPITTVINYQSKNQLDHLDSTNHFARLQILLTMFAGKFFQEFFLYPNQVSIINPPFKRLKINHSPPDFSGIRILHCNPRALNTQGWFENIDVTLSDEEIAASFYDLRQVIELLHDPQIKQKIKELMKKKREAWKGVIPTTFENEPYQRLLLPP